MPFGQSPKERQLVARRVGAARGSTPRHGHDGSPCAHGLSQKAHAAMADDDARQADLARERLGREEALPGEPPWGGTGVADLCQAEHSQGGAGAIRGLDELVEAVHEGADGNEDHKSGPRAQHGPGERPQLLRPLDEEEVGNRVDQPSGQAGLEAAAGLDEDDSAPP